jgi:hypothetical protein
MTEREMHAMTEFDPLDQPPRPDVFPYSPAEQRASLPLWAWGEEHKGKRFSALSEADLHYGYGLAAGFAAVTQVAYGGAETEDYQGRDAELYAALQHARMIVDAGKAWSERRL